MQIKKIGSMATFPAREKTLTQVIDSLIDQLDILYIYLNEYDAIPNFLTGYEKVVPILGREHYGDLNANGKMIYLNYDIKNSYIFTLDDDIIFPPDYVSYMVDVMQSMNNKIAVTVHGSIIPDTASWYYERTHVYGAKKSLDEHKAVNLIGSGTFAYFSDNIPLKFKKFTDEVYVDLHLSLEALKNGIPLIALKRLDNWIEFIKYDGLWEQFKIGVTHHTRILQTNDVWRLNNLKRVWKNFLHSQTNDIHQFIRDKNLDSDMCLNIDNTTVPFAWRGSRISLTKVLDFVNNLEGTKR